MKEITVKNQFNNDVTISLIGTFKIETLDKEYIIYSIVDDKMINDYFRSFNYEERIDLNELFMDIKTKK